LATGSNPGDISRSAAGKEFDCRIAAASRLAPQNSVPAAGFLYAGN